MIFQIVQLRLRHLAGCVRPDRLKHVLNTHVVALEPAGHDRAAVEHERGQVQPSQRHHGTGDGLVASRKGHDRVEQVPARDQFNRVRDDLAADQGGLHALRAHRDAVGDGDRVVLDGRAPAGANAGFDLLGQSSQVVIAGHHLDPGVGDAH